MAYGDFKHLPRRTTFGKLLPDKAFGIAKNLEHDGYHYGFASMVYNFFDEKSAATSACRYAAHTGKGIYYENHQSAEELHKPIIRKYIKNRYTLLLKIIFGIYVLLIFSVNMLQLFLSDNSR